MDFFLFSSFCLLLFVCLFFNLNYITLNVCLKHRLQFCVYHLFRVTLDNSSASFVLNFQCMKLEKVSVSFFFFPLFFLFLMAAAKFKRSRSGQGPGLMHFQKSIIKMNINANDRFFCRPTNHA